jgi:hypothetical protein
MNELTAEQEGPAQNVKCGYALTPEKTTYDDSSGAIFSMYLTQAQKLDEENVENWTGVADRILIFVRFQTVPSRRLSSSYLPHRPAFSHQLWPLLLPSAIRACSKIPTSSLSLSSHRYPNNSLTQLTVIPVGF